jgi:hypothetical protein
MVALEVAEVSRNGGAVGGFGGLNRVAEAAQGSSRGCENSAGTGERSGWCKGCASSMGWMLLRLLFSLLSRRMRREAET